MRDHIALIDSVGADILRECMEHQNGRAPANGANAPKTTFTEGWFRTSGLYKLCDGKHGGLSRQALVEAATGKDGDVAKTYAKFYGNAGEVLSKVNTCSLFNVETDLTRHLSQIARLAEEAWPQAVEYLLAAFAQLRHAVKMFGKRCANTTQTQRFYIVG